MSTEAICLECGTLIRVEAGNSAPRLTCKACGAVTSIPVQNDGLSLENPGQLSSNNPRKVNAAVTWDVESVIGAGIVVCLAIVALSLRFVFTSPPSTILRDQIDPYVNSVGVNPSSIGTSTAGGPLAGPNAMRPVPALKPSGRIQKQLESAKSELIRNGQSKNFCLQLQSVAADLPELTVSPLGGEVKWNQCTLPEYDLSAFRFTSSLDGPGDLFWCFASIYAPRNFGIIPIEGSLPTIQGGELLDGERLEGLDVPVQSTILAHQLLGGCIEPKKTYVIYFVPAASAMFPLRIAMRLLPAKRYHDQNVGAERILRLIGINRVSKPNPTPGSLILTGHTDEIIGHFWNAAGELVSIDADGNLHNWDMATGRINSRTEIGGPLNQTLFSADGRRAVLLGHPSSSVSVLDLGTNKISNALLQHDGNPIQGCFSADESCVYVMYESPSIEKRAGFELVKWSLDQNQILARWQIDGTRGCHLRLSSTGPSVLGSQVDERGPGQAVRLTWDADLSDAPDIRMLPGSQTVSAISLQNGAHELLVDFFGVVSLINPKDGTVEYTATLPYKSYAACPLSDDRYVAIAGRSGSIQLHDTKSRQTCMTWVGHDEFVRNLSLSPDGRTLASFGSDGVIRLWDTTQRDRIARVPSPILDSQQHELQLIPSADFEMGSRGSYHETTRYLVHHSHRMMESPSHRVRISRPFYVASKEVTVGQFRKFVEATGYVTNVEANGMGGHVLENLRQGFIRKKELNWRSPGYPQTDQHPVVQVTYHDAVAYCQWLSEVERATYRLPTEAEWEFACGANPLSQCPFVITELNQSHCFNIADSSIVDAMGEFFAASKWNDGHAFAATVGSYWPNQYGLFDMLGNVWEICADDWSENYSDRVDADAVVTDPIHRGGGRQLCRGGSFYSSVLDARSCRREYMELYESEVDVGFRVVREISSL